jgi:hypothetical protein
VTHPQVRPDPAFGLLKLYDDALPHVYGYLLARCGDTGLAEDLTAESFLAAVHAVRNPGAPDPSIPWLIGVARHKLADHWRRVEREQRGLRLLDGEPARVDDSWETVVDRIRAREVLDRLGARPAPRGRARAHAVRAARRVRRRPGCDVPPLAAGPLTEALERGGEHQLQAAFAGRAPSAIGVAAPFRAVSSPISRYASASRAASSAAGSTESSCAEGAPGASGTAGNDHHPGPHVSNPPRRAAIPVRNHQQATAGQPRRPAAAEPERPRP